jgi:hypothetical protein
MEPIECRYLYKTTEFARALLAYYLGAGAWLLAALFAMMFGVTTISDLASRYAAHTLNTHTLLAALATNLFGALCFLAVMVPFMVALQCWAFRGIPVANQNLTYAISDSGIRMEGGSIKTELGWSAFTSARESSRGFMLYLGKGKRSMHWLPRHGFASIGEVNRCRELIRNKIAANKLSA